jgi:2',3'-cyclic-nucleotide 2'-phosphodiesterase (5'-nucleotidase family)
VQVAADREGKDVFLVNSGDMCEGTGLSDSTPITCNAVQAIVRQMPFDAMTIGNHELYHNRTINNLRSVVVRLACHSTIPPFNPSPSTL